ncbi:hypothetical protein SprV_1002859800 [Sparganum proliferum]
MLVYLRLLRAGRGAYMSSIPQDLAIETIELLLQSKYDEPENRLGHAQILQLRKLSLRTYYMFDGTVYEQVKGTPMGSPISGLIAEAVLQRLESLVILHHKPKVWARYVDDTFVIIERDQVLTFQEHLNAVFPDIQFTMGEEENNQLAFLDVLVCRKDFGGLKTKEFRKAANTMQLLNFNSNHPISHKRSCVRTLYRRVETHCSEPEDKIDELQYLRRSFTIHRVEGVRQVHEGRVQVGPHRLTLLLKLTGGEDHVRGPTMSTEAALALRLWTLFEMVVEAVEVNANEDLPGDVQQGDATVIFAYLAVPFSLVEMHDGCVRYQDYSL